MNRMFLLSLKIFFTAAAFAFVSFVFIVLLVMSNFPSQKQIRGCMTTQMHKVNLCPTDNSYVKLKEISPYVITTVVLTEDSSFWNHGGFDIQELKKSLEKNLKEGRYARGGSTITQQLAKNLFLTKDKTLTRKAKEAALTFQIEKSLSKREILERYLNVVQFGKDIFGIKKASQFYFQKTPKQLDLIESIYLAFLLPSPEKYSKSFFKKELTPFADKRINEILERLFEYDRINRDEYLAGKSRLQSFLRSNQELDVPEELKSLDESTVEPEEN
jgi:monofunctional glycosyltransferase